MPDLLLELFSEEIPARMQPRAAADLRRLVTDALVERGLTYAEAGAHATPRRLTLTLTGLPALSPDTVEERRGPRVDAPEKALEGFLRSTGLAREDLEARDDKKGQVWFASTRRPGRPADDIVAEVVPEVIRGFPWPKSMRWGEGSLRWVRPLHSILCILSDEAGARVVSFEVDGLSSGDTTAGHRFMAPRRFPVAGFEDYAAKLKAARVMLDPDERAEKIEHDARQLAFARGLELVEDPGLLAEVAGLVEWPVVLMGAIEERFLELPPEVLRTSMKEHQKFFSARNPGNGRIEAFVTVANIEAPDGGAAILAGNARVLAARLADAAFFWENDLRVVKTGGMEAMAEPLKKVTFHGQLGTQWERTLRIAALAREIAPYVAADPDTAERAARLAKADLASAMVYEFPELQGTMGRYYALAAGEPPEVAAAAEGHYAPLGPSDAVPTEPVTVAVALADKLDLLTGFWAIDEKPTGSKDPFALRRAALGVIRTLLSNGEKNKLSPIINFSFRLHRDRNIGQLARPGEPIAFWQFPEDTDEPTLLWPATEESDEPPSISDGSGFLLLNVSAETEIHYTEMAFEEDWKQWSVWSQSMDFKVASRPYRTSPVLSFLADRLKVHLREEGIRHDVIQACFELGGQDDLVLLVARVRALQKFLETEDGEHLLTGYRRANNIIRQALGETPEADVEAPVDPSLFRQPEEHALAEALATAEAQIAPALDTEDFTAAMAAMARLRPPIDAFFDEVTVNADDAALRLNRLALLARIRTVMRAVAVWDAIEG